ncbi:TrkA family potassium uptake protein [Bacillus sp. V2I10]|uniref:potassium channel family protein n=1 Tax=Bacillus sp. V2I10 TaxID=3042276 RepID=UPI0027823EEA|nr:TrkA family potassium uptake protein [Bacillus sp. V2I10]MDQ0859895.1 trk system potassium uptake protein TrkA [Bacillus sp. V2I10]
MKKQFAVLGLGSFGGTLIEELSLLDVEIIALDKDMEVVNKYADKATIVVQANGINERELESLGIRNVDQAIVSFGDEVENSILATLVLKEMGIKQVWVKASNLYHKKVLKKIGADRVILPEHDMARRIAHYIESEKIIDYIELSSDYSLVEIKATKKLSNRSLLDLDARARYGCTIIGIKRNNTMIISPSAKEIILENDILFVIGDNEGLTRFEENEV